MNLLHIDTSIRGEQSVSRLLSRATVQRMQEHDPAIDVIYRDLVATPVPHLTGEHLLGSTPCDSTDYARWKNAGPFSHRLITKDC